MADGPALFRRVWSVLRRVSGIMGPAAASALGIAATQGVRPCQLLVEELASAYDWSVVGDGSRCRGRYHWEPAPSLDIALVPRPVTTT